MKFIHTNTHRVSRSGLGLVVAVTLSVLVAVVHITGWGVLHNEDLEMGLYLFGLPVITGLSVIGLLRMSTHQTPHSEQPSPVRYWRCSVVSVIVYACLERAVFSVIFQPGYLRFSPVQKEAIVQWSILICLFWFTTLVITFGIPWKYVSLQQKEE